MPLRAPVSDALKLPFIVPQVWSGVSSPLHHKMYYSKGLGRVSGRGHHAESGSSFLTMELPGASSDGSKGLTTVRASAHQGKGDLGDIKCFPPLMSP